MKTIPLTQNAAVAMNHAQKQASKSKAWRGVRQRLILRPRFFLSLLLPAGVFLALAGAASAQPVITNEPASLTDCAGYPAVFSVGATSTGTLTYQWQVSGDGGTTFTNTPLGNGTLTASYTVPSPTVAQSGYEYRVIVTDTNSLSVTSAPPAVLTVIPTPAAPTTTWAVTCSPGPVTLYASGGSGTLTWYSDATLTNPVATGPSYSLTISSTTNFYVTETGADGCVSPASLAEAALGPPTASAGPNQYLDPSTNTIQLAGFAGNGARAGTWSGGSGTFAPDANTTNAVYTPSAAEKAAGSWALTLTATTPCGTATSTMSFFFVSQLLLTLNTNQSWNAQTIVMNPLNLSPKSSSASNTLMGFVKVQPTTYGQPAMASLRDYDYIATGPYDFSWSWPLLKETLTAELDYAATYDSDPGPVDNPFYPVYGNQVTFTNLPYGTLGILYLTNVLSTNTTYLNLPYITAGVNTNNNNPAYLVVTNGVAWMALYTGSYTTNYSTNLSTSFASSGQIIATGPAASQPPHALVWNNGASTGNWNTSDANWNLGTMVWNNNSPDNAIFTNTGVGTVTLTMPITAGWLEFGYPGYTITGSTLALSGTSAITNDADATVASAIISGVVNKWGLGTLTLSGANTYSGASTVNAGALRLGSSSALPGTGLILGGSTNTVRLDLNGYSATVGAFTGGANAIVDNLSGGTGTLSVGNNGASGTFSGVIQNTAGSVSLDILSAGTLVLGSGASLGSAISVSIAAGATLDVSALTNYNLGSSATLTASGTASPATIKGLSGGTVDLGAQPIVLNYDGTHPALTVAQSTLNLDGNTITINAPFTLDEGTYPLMQVTGAGSIVTNGSFTVNGTAIARGYAATLSVSGSQLMVNLVRFTLPTTTTIGPFAPTQTYGSVILGATVSPTDATGTVTFYSGVTNVGTATLINGTATGPAVQNLLPVGSHPITASYGGDDYYAGSSSASSSNLTVTIRTVSLAGGKAYDKKATITPGTGLTIAPNYDGAGLYLAPPGGVAYLAGWNTGPETVTNIGQTIVTNVAVITTNFIYNTPSRVQYAGGTGGSWSLLQAASFTVTLPANSTAHNTLVAVINSDYNSTGAVSGIGGGGAVTWTQLGTAENGSGCVWGSETEMWYAPNITGGDNSVTITINSTGNPTCFVIAEAVVMEYTNLVHAGSPLDGYNSASGGSSPAQSGTVTPSPGCEVWVAGLGTANSSGYTTLSGQSSGWTFINSQSQNVTLSGYGQYNTIYAYDKVATNAATASCSANESSSTAWAGVIGAFKGTVPYPPYILTTNYTFGTNASFALAGPAAGNYSLIYTGAVTINPTNLTVTAAANAKLYDGTTSAAAHPTITAGSIQTGDTAPTWTETYADRNAGTGKTLVPTTLLVNDGNYGTNYSYTFAPVTTGVINPTNLTVTAIPNTKTYDGTTSATNIPTWSGYLQTGDSVGPTNFWEIYDNPNPRTGKTLTPAGGVSDGNNGLNYSYNYAPVTTGVITPLAIAQQPTNLTNCAGSPAIFTVDLPPAAGLTYQWQVSQDGGTTFTNISDTETNASYTNASPASADNGNQYQVIVGEGTTSLTSAPPAVLTIVTPPIVSAGSNQTICAGSSVSLNGSVSGCTNTGTWSSSGSGTFVPDATTLNGTYIPSGADIAAGSVTLCLVAQCEPCPVVTNCMEVTIHALPVVTSQPTNLIVYAGLPAVFSVEASGSNLTYQWQVSTNNGTNFYNISDTETNASYTNLDTTLDENGYEYQVIVGSSGCTLASTQAVLTVSKPLAIVTITTLGALPSPQQYGGLVLSATVSTPGGSVTNGQVTFLGGATVLGTVNVTSGPPATASFATNLAAGTYTDIQATYHDPLGIFADSSSGTASLQITPRVATLGGSMTYNGGTAITPDTGLTIANNVDGSNLTLSPSTGAATLAAKNTGSETITSIATIITNVSYNTPSRVQTATNGGGYWAGTTNGTLTVTLANSPANGNMLVAVITTDRTNAPMVSGITNNSGTVNWTYATSSSGSIGLGYGAETEIWYATNVQNAGKSATITFKAPGVLIRLGAAAVVAEYSGVATSGALDQTATNSAYSSASYSTGTTPTTTQANELWLAAVGILNGGPSNGTYVTVSSYSPGWQVANYCDKSWVLVSPNTYYYDTIYMLDTNVTAIGQANCSGNLSASTNWAAVIAAFKASIYNTSYTTNYLTLDGPAAPNYTLSGWSGSVTVNWTNLTLTAAANTKLYDGTTNAAAHPTITVGGIQTGDTAPTWTEAYANRNVGTGKTLTPAALVVNDGNSGLNYNYTYTPTNTGVINPTNLMLTAVANTKLYDGTNTAAALPSITAGSVQPGDTTSAFSFWETYDNPNVGTGKTLTPAGVVSDGNGGTNYNYTYTPVTTGEIDALGTTTALAVDINPSGLTSNVTFTATVAGVLPTVGSPSGSVVFLANGTPFATNGPLVAGIGGSSITASTTALPAGTNAMTAQYLGDGNYLPSTNTSPLAQVVINNVIYSQTNSITSVVNHHDGTFTLNFTGTPGAQYYVVAQGNPEVHMTNWIPVVGSTNTASSPSGAWSCVVSNAAPAYYRAVAVNPAP
jgi:autotransporter-associated beta strand protein